MRRLIAVGLALCLLAAPAGRAQGAGMPPPFALTFAVIGDYGYAGQPAEDVADLVKGWSPNLIVTTGDNNYDAGLAITIDRNIGQYYHDYIYPYSGSYGAGAARNRFFPVLGNHDWEASGARPYLDYFTLPGNERYYDFVEGPVHFFMLDSDPHEPDGITAASTQARWLRDRLAASSSPWKLVLLHHAPYSSGQDGSTAALQWPYADWGADAVLAGHDHHYERLLVGGLLYFVNGAGGKNLLEIETPVAGSQVRYNGDFGAMRVTAGADDIVYEFYNRRGERIDLYRQTAPVVEPPPIPSTGSLRPAIPMLFAPGAR